MAHDEGNGVERRIDLAIALTRLADNTEALKEVQDACVEDRKALYKRMGQVDVQLGVIKSKQTTITWTGSIAILAVVGLIGRWVASHFPKG